MIDYKLDKSRLNVYIVLIVSILIIFIWLCFNSSQITLASPTDVKSLEAWQQRIEQQRDAIAQQHEKLSDIHKAALGYLNILKDHVEIADIKLQDYQYQLRQATQDLKSLEAQLEEAQKSYQPKLVATVERLRLLQRQPISSQGWDLLLKSDNLNEFLDRRHRLQQVYQSDRAKLQQLQAEASKIKEQKMIVAERKNQIALIQQQLAVQKDQIEAQSGIQEELIQRLKSDRTALEAAETQLDKDSESIGILIRERGGSYYGGGSGKFRYPNSARISSGFGWRVHPILKYKRMHTGVDFAGGYGSDIYAAASGKVIFAGWYGGYGNAVVIDHGKGITTLYGHTSKLYVSEGQYISKGKAIAAVGSTGFSTGPHLHFEVRENGKPVNPMNYL